MCHNIGRTAACHQASDSHANAVDGDTHSGNLDERFFHDSHETCANKDGIEASISCWIDKSTKEGTNETGRSKPPAIKTADVLVDTFPVVRR